MQQPVTITVGKTSNPTSIVINGWTIPLVVVGTDISEVVINECPQSTGALDSIFAAPIVGIPLGCLIAP